MPERAGSDEAVAIGATLVKARAEMTSDRARRLFQAAIAMCDDWTRKGGGSDAQVLKSRILAEMAVESQVAAERSQIWRSALSTARPPDGDLDNYAAFAETYAGIAVDFFQDLYSSSDLQERTLELRAAKVLLDVGLRSTSDDRTTATLLSRKSSVLRQLSTCELNPDRRSQKLTEASRCAARAVRLGKTEHTLLELGLTEWAAARNERTDELYVTRLRAAEEAFSSEALRHFEPAQFSLARFYRLTYQPLKACRAFPRRSKGVANIRRVLRDSSLLGEAACQLWFAEYPEEVVRPYLEEARDLLESALSSGYQNARLVVTLAFVRALLDGVDAGATALTDLSSGSGISWEKAIQLALDTEPSNLLELGLVLGIDQSAIWTRLGTFVGRFLKNRPLAERLYRTAVVIDPHDPIALTNLARFLVDEGTNESRTEARRLIQKASTFADRRFTWWRAVMARLDGPAPPRKASGPGVTTAREYVEMVELRRGFKRLVTLDDAQARGYALEKFVYQLAHLTFGTAAPSYKFDRLGGSSQIDAYFQHGADKYRVECKWRGEPADHVQIVDFADKLDVVGVSGLFISMAGFTESAVGRVRDLRNHKVILLMDGDEVTTIFDLQLTFDEVMTRKRLFFDQRSEPYHRVFAPQDSA